MIVNELSTVILAGGQSSRMGRDKARIEINGVPMLRRVYDAARPYSCEIYVVTSRVEAYRSLLPLDAKFIAEIEPRGPAIAFAQALPYLSTEWVLLLACDLPQLDEAQLKCWTTLLDSVPNHAIQRSLAAPIALLPKHEKGWEPLCGFYRRTCLPELVHFIDQGGSSFQKWLSNQLIQELPVSAPQVLFNCNTPDDLEQVVQQF